MAVVKKPVLNKVLTIRVSRDQLVVLDRLAQLQDRKRADVARRLLVQAIEAEALKK